MSARSSKFLLLTAIISTCSLGSASSDECTRSDSTSAQVLVVPSAGPTLCLPLDDYIQLREGAAGVANGDGETTDAPSSTSAPSSQGHSSRSLLLYRYMSPLWLQSHADFTETPSVSAQTIEFSNGLSLFGVLFRVNLFEAGVLDEDKSYSIQLGSFFAQPVGPDDGPFQICDGNYCVGFTGRNPPDAIFHSGNDSVSVCSRDEFGSRISAPQNSTTLNFRLEINPNSTSGTIYVSTSSATYEYNQKLRPSRGLQFKACRRYRSYTPQFRLFELAVHLNE